VLKQQSLAEIKKHKGVLLYMKQRLKVWADLCLQTFYLLGHTEKAFGTDFLAKSFVWEYI